MVAVHGGMETRLTDTDTTQIKNKQIMLNKISRTILINAGLHKVFLAV